MMARYRSAAAAPAAMAARAGALRLWVAIYASVRRLSVDWQICQATAKGFVLFYSIPENPGKSPRAQGLL